MSKSDDGSDRRVKAGLKASDHKLLVNMANEAGISARTLLRAALRAYRKCKSADAPSAQNIDPKLAKRFREIRSAVARSWWDKQTPEEKSRRAKEAANARWGKKEAS